jgi:uncharacterized C2H2 Zn-finger protein
MSLPTPPILPTNPIEQCPTCKKLFKTKRGLKQYEAIVRRYNSFHVRLYKLPKKFIEEFKKTLVLLIHRQLPCHFSKLRLKTFTVACTES